MEKPWHTLPSDSILRDLGTNMNDGLSEEEAKRRLEKTGRNVIREEKEKKFISEALEEFTEPMIILLLVVGAVYAISGELVDAITIFAVIVALVGVEAYNDIKAGRTIRSLRTLARSLILVKRGGQYREIDSEDLAPGDVVLLQAGRRVPADIRIVEAYSLMIDESALTGESGATSKSTREILSENAPLSARTDMAFAGCLVIRGKGIGVVVETGPRTELGKIASLAKGQKPPRTPLQLTMRELTKWMVFVALGFSFGVPLLAWLINGQPPETMLLTALSLAFATIPEELPIIITMVLALGGYRLSKQNAVVKKLKAVETLGAVTVIATDKTGTLTKNHMTVTAVRPEGMRREMIGIGILCSDAVETSEGVRGDPIEVALYEEGTRLGIDPMGLRASRPLKEENPFDNDRRLMSTVHAYGGSAYIAVKGAPEAVLVLCTELRDENATKALTDDERTRLLDEGLSLANEGLRVLAFAERTTNQQSIGAKEAESDLVFIGLMGFLDPPRIEVKDAIATIRKAGVRTIMVTGDHPETASRVASMVGLDSGAAVVTGDQIAKADDATLREILRTAHVFARTEPDQKMRIVNALHANGERVAVTGDGINDAPALAAADIGIAMGASGTDAARDAADIILMDDDFGTIAKAIREGRRLFANMSKGVKYYLACKVALIAAFVVSLIALAPLPFSPVQIILLELFMDLGASAAFVAERPEGDLMLQPPRDPKERFLTRRFTYGVFVSAAGLAAIVSITYLVTWNSYNDLARAQSVALLGWLVGHFFLALNMRTDREPLVRLGITTNPTMLVWGASALVFGAIAVGVPYLYGPLHTAAVSATDVLLVIVVAFIGTFWIEARKLLTYKGPKS
ncbi:MAG: cation-transporting P-type ATPase [Methanomassiliicoccales archaeon]